MKKIATLIVVALSLCGCKDKAEEREAPASARIAVPANDIPLVLGFALRDSTGQWCLQTSDASVNQGQTVSVVWRDENRFDTDTVPPTKKAIVGASVAQCRASADSARAFLLTFEKAPFDTTAALVVRPEAALRYSGSYLRANLDVDSAAEFVMGCRDREGIHFIIVNDTTVTDRARWQRFIPGDDNYSYCGDEQLKLARAVGPKHPIIIPEGSGEFGWYRPGPGAQWLVLRQAGTTWELAATAVREVQESDCEEGTHPRLEPADSTKWIALFTNIGSLRAGALETAAVLDDVEYQSMADSVRMVFRKDTLTIRRTDFESGFRLQLERRGQSPILLFEEGWQDEGHWEFRWAGDLDRDGQLDLIIGASRKYSVHPVQLYLSTFGRTGGGWNPLAEYVNVAC